MTPYAQALFDTFSPKPPESIWKTLPMSAPLPDENECDGLVTCDWCNERVEPQQRLHGGMGCSECEHERSYSMED